MRLHAWLETRLGKGVALILVLVAAAALIGMLAGGASSRAGASAHPRIEATIFSYDGNDFIRTQTTLVDEKGRSAVNTRMDRNTPAFKALVDKHSYFGEVTIFGKKYDGDYAPLTSDDGQVIGGLFVGVAKK